MPTKIKSCLGCTAYEPERCDLGYRVRSIPTVSGFYGQGGLLIGCSIAPVETCPKPWTVKEYTRLWKIKYWNSDGDKNG